jgi:hypothetical protein
MNQTFSKLLIGVALLESYCKEAKDRHFHTAKKKAKCHRGYGLAGVIASALVTSELLGGSLLDKISYPQWLAAITPFIKPSLSVSAAVFTAVVTFMKFEKEAAAHFTVGNKYARLAHRARGILEIYSGKDHPTAAEISSLKLELKAAREEFFAASADGAGLFTAAPGAASKGRSAQKGTDASDGPSRQDLKNAVAAFDANWIANALRSLDSPSEKAQAQVGKSG